MGDTYGSVYLPKVKKVFFFFFYQGKKAWMGGYRRRVHPIAVCRSRAFKAIANDGGWGVHRFYYQKRIT